MTINNDNVVELLKNILEKATSFHASDVHIEPFKSLLRIRLRVDGTLIEILNLKKNISENLISRIKVISGLDISECRLPQDGNFVFKNNINVRVSILNTVYGEKAVLRIIYSDERFLDKNNLGFFENDLKAIEKVFKSTHGAIIITGPTSSGKTTTLNSFIKNINDIDKNIFTIEDPVENFIFGVNQVDINPKINFDFSDALRAILRQDPDIIMIGEIRDLKTAEIVVRASITGHLVLATMHTNDSISAINRLIDMGINKFMIAAGVNIIISQRLVRRLCDNCKKKIKINKTDSQFLNINQESFIYEAVGCDKCRQIGYTGRFVIYEYFIFDDDIRSMFNNENYIDRIKKYLELKKMSKLIDNGIKNLLLGKTSVEEIKKNIIFY
ncbi:MAG: GspE/PulE family protein [Clostridiales bacterium]|jgi:type IV pilus assembly protein PilB|nr:GspE/PulE family protein [Clostridiales bacterium]